MEIERENPSVEKETRRRGVAFDTLAHVFRDVREFLFQNGLRFRNRPGEKIDENKKVETGRVNVKNMTEMYYDTAGDDGMNVIMIGRHGNGQYRNTNMIELSAQHNTAVGNGEGNTNGWVKLRVTRDDDDPAVDRVGVSVFDVGSRITEFEGVSVQIVSMGEQGGVVISHNPTRGANPPSNGTPTIWVDKDGIGFQNLPTSDPHLKGYIFQIGTDLKISNG